MISNV
jgi:hypothetical protein